MSKKRGKDKLEASTSKDEMSGGGKEVKPGAATGRSRSWNPLSFLTKCDKTQIEGHTKEAGLEIIRDSIERHGTHIDNIGMHPYYHGQMHREDAEESGLLCCDGDFLLRESFNADKPIVLSVRWTYDQYSYVHVSLDFDKDKSTWSLGGKWLESLPTLIEYHVKSGAKVSEKKAVLKYPIPRPAYVIDGKRIKKKAQLGQGRFGMVFKGELYRSADDQENPEIVAIKEISVRSVTQDGELAAEIIRAKGDFLKEVRLMKDFNHKNVVRFLGVQHLKDPMQIIMELLPNGSLDNYLKNNYAKIRTEELLRFCVDAAEGLAYLKEKKCVHCDIASRNCLVTAKKGVKISDFGLAKKGFLEKMKVGEGDVVPVPWCSPETLSNREWSHQSDVWMFGVLMWEIYNKAEVPHRGLKAKEIVSRAKAGNHLGRKAGGRCPECVRRVMNHCFKVNPHARTTIEKAMQDLQDCQGIQEVTAKSTTKDKGHRRVKRKKRNDHRPKT